jgi:hypothetical protein
VNLTSRPRAILAALCLFVVPVAGLRAQGTAVVPSIDLVYQDLDRLAELGFLDSAIAGQRPYSRRELARISVLVRAQLARDSAAVDAATLRAVSTLSRRLTERFGARTLDVVRAASEGRASLDHLSYTFSSTDAVRRGFPPGFASALEATIDPLAERRLGTPAPSGGDRAWEIGGRFEPTGWLAFQARERTANSSPRDPGNATTSVELLLGFARARFRNVAFTAGRAQLTWAQGEGDGLFLASDAPALDQLSLASEHPFRLPWLFSRLGPAAATLVIADLGPSVVRSHSKLLAYKVSVKPAASLELGATFMNHYGGEGGAPSSFGDHLIDFLPFIDIFRKHNYYDPSRPLDVDSDKLLGVDGRWRVPRLGGATLAGELLIDDFDVHRIPSLFAGYGSSTIALTVPKLGTPDWSMRLSAKHMGILTYTHSALSNGITTRGRLLGDELGPDAKAFAAELRWQPTHAIRATLDGRSALYSQATYAHYYVDADSVRFVVNKVSSGPNELRDRLRGSLELRGSGGFVLVLRAGGERTRNALFAGTAGVHYALEAAMRAGL